MCLLTRQIKPIITKKDMIVIKKLFVATNGISNNYFSYYRRCDFRYIPETLYKTLLDVRRVIPMNTASFGDYDTMYYKQGKLLNRKLTVVEQGFHFIIQDSDSAKELGVNNIFKFLVPKGSTIYLGKTGCGVSNQIIMLKS